MLYSKKVQTSGKNDSLSQVFELIVPNSCVLDIGCATGGLAKQLFAQKQCSVFGLEQNPKSVALCQKSQSFAEVSVFDLNKLTSSDFPSYKSKFDYIVCADVLEHLQNPPKTIEILQNLLKKDGKFIISLPNVAHASIKTNLLLNDFSYTEIGILDKTHLHFYTYKSIAELLSQQNLKIEQARAITMPLDGWQPNKFSQLLPEIRNFISQDKHSHIMQYVVLASQSVNTSKLKYHNLNLLKNIAASPQKNTLIWQTKRLIINRYPTLLKCIEKITSKF